MTTHELFFKRVFAHLDEQVRLLYDPRWPLLRRGTGRIIAVQSSKYIMYSWTHDEYVAAIADQTFYGTIYHY
ncbi:hypothetical protein Plhal304r1_c077g0164101 [Plasmopara halstedii]